VCAGGERDVTDGSNAQEDQSKTVVKIQKVRSSGGGLGTKLKAVLLSTSFGTLSREGKRD